MNDDRRKLLTLMIGECWHEWIPTYCSETEDVSMRGHKCSICGGYWCTKPHFNGPISPRPFTTWADLGAVVEAIQKAGKTYSFYWSVWEKWVDEENGDIHKHQNFAFWLFGNPSRFCDLAGEWAESLKEDERWWVK